MENNKLKLIIWDFDGVIADTEKLYLQNRQKLLNQFFNLNWDLKTTKNYLGGMSNHSAKENLERSGIYTNEKFWSEVAKLDRKILKSGFNLIPDIVKVLKKVKYKQCLATGGGFSLTRTKIKIAGIESFFNRKNIFTVDMVKKGKPEPDLFLLAAQKMGVKPEECLVVEDSIAGLTAALKAGIKPVAFVGTDIHNNSEYKQTVKDMGIKYIFDEMGDLYNFIQSRR